MRGTPLLSRVPYTVCQCEDERKRDAALPDENIRMTQALKYQNVSPTQHSR